MQKQNIEASEEEIQVETQKIADQYGGMEEFEQVLSDYGYSMENIKVDIKAYVEKRKLLGPSITITDEEMKNSFEENKDTFNEATYKESADQIRESLFEEKLSAAYATWLQDKYTEYGVESYISQD